MSGVSCIIPAFNEGPRIGAVLRALALHPLIDEVIVVDDGSTDDTAAVAGGVAGVRLHLMAQNGGKTRALAAGIALARHDHLLLIDADLIGLAADDLTRLMVPVLHKGGDMSISLRRNAPRLWHWIGIDYISGERLLRRDLVSNRLSDLAALPPFGFEVWLNRLALRAGARIVVVDWPDVDSPAKTAKRGRLAGWAADMRMMGDLFRTVPPLALLRQIIGMVRHSHRAV